MLQTLPPLNWFRAFECSARHLSFTAAATELNLTQSAISQQVRLLETRLSTVLFSRKARGLALTDDGRRLLPYVSGAMGNLEEGIAMFDPIQSSGVLIIACSISFSVLWLTPRLKRFLSAHSGLDVRIVSTMWPDHHITSGADIDIRFGSKELVGDSATLLTSDSIFPVCTPAVADGLNHWADICQIPLVQTVGTSDSWHSWADDLGLAPPPPCSRSVDTTVLAIEHARNDDCIALAYGLLAEQFIQSKELVMPLGLSALAKDNHYITLADTPGKTVLAKAFRDWIYTEVEIMQQGVGEVGVIN